MIPKNKRKSEPDLCVLLDQLIDQAKSEINCVSIGTIEAFYSDDQTADVKLAYRKINLIDHKLTDLQLVVKCPVAILNGGGSYITHPIEKGDTCVVFFNDREIDTWFTNGGINAPQSARVHDLNDGIVLVGIKNSLNKIGSYFSGLKLFYKSGYITIDASGNIAINSPGNVTVQATGNITVEASGNTTIKGAVVNINP